MPDANLPRADVMATSGEPLLVIGARCSVLREGSSAALVADR
jgi:hypothetical protein